MRKVLCAVGIAIALIMACEHERVDKPNPFEHASVATIR